MDYTPPPSDHAPPPPPPPRREDIPNYLVWSILVTLCCCVSLPVIGTIPGIVAIVYGAQVNSRRDQGDIAGAWEASKKAKMWLIIAAVLAVIGIVISVVFGFLTMLLGMAGM